MKISPLFALSAGSFAIGMTEFSPMGLLPAIASGMGVTIPTAGLLISAYAFGVAVMAPVVTLMSGRMARNRLLILLMAIFALGNLMSSLSPSYEVLAIARVITAICQGTFFGVGSVVAASLVAPGRQAGAVAAIFSGLTVATVIGVPASTWMGDAFGWRVPFAVIAALGILVMFALSVSLPHIEGQQNYSVLPEIRTLLSRSVLGALGLTVLSSTGQFTLFTYVAPLLRDGTGVSVQWVSITLVLIGVGMAVGNVLGGRAADKSLQITMVSCFALLVILLLCLSNSYKSFTLTLVMLTVWGALVFALVPTLQTRVMSGASSAPNLASSVNIGAFNLGNGLGAALGSVALSAGSGYRGLILASAGVFVLTFILVIIFRTKTTGFPSKRLTEETD